jgi:fructose-1,6-bisphosphatase
MVPDIHHILAKGNGIFVNLGGGKYPDGKLRLTFECGPFAFLIEEAGGYSSNGEKSILDIPIEAIDQRTQMIVGSKNEVEHVEKALRERKD